MRLRRVVPPGALREHTVIAAGRDSSRVATDALTVDANLLVHHDYCGAGATGGKMSAACGSLPHVPLGRALRWVVVPRPLGRSISGGQGEKKSPLVEWAFNVGNTGLEPVTSRV